MATSSQFSILSLRPELLTGLDNIGYANMTLVQATALPPMLEGQDVLARARTGSGKTAAFGLAVLNGLDANSFITQSLVLCPTRELADQVAKELRRLARAIGNIKILTLCGGTSLGPQIASLQHSPHIVVGTPGRVLHHLRKEKLDLAKLSSFVLDEADRMLDMGFADELDEVAKYLPDQRQTLLFSATYPSGIEQVSKRIQREPVLVDVTDDEQPAAIRQYWCDVTRENRPEKLHSALRAWGGALNLVFCNTKIDCDAVANALRDKGVAAVALHGDLDQIERNRVLVRFANKSATVLVATDVAARGLDVKNLDAVFNYELPKQADVYVHRIGRTGRAGEEGVAVSLVEARETGRWEAIEEQMGGVTAEKCDIPVYGRRSSALEPAMATLQIKGGRKNKLRPGDLLGALTAEGGVPGTSVGSIDLFETYGYIAIARGDVSKALRQLANRPIKGRRYRVWSIRD